MCGCVAFQVILLEACVALNRLCNPTYTVQTNLEDQLTEGLDPRALRICINSLTVTLLNPEHIHLGLQPTYSCHIPPLLATSLCLSAPPQLLSFTQQSPTQYALSVLAIGKASRERRFGTVSRLLCAAVPVWSRPTCHFKKRFSRCHAKTT